MHKRRKLLGRLKRDRLYTLISDLINRCNCKDINTFAGQIEQIFIGRYTGRIKLNNSIDAEFTGYRLQPRSAVLHQIVDNLSGRRANVWIRLRNKGNDRRIKIH